MTCYRSVIFPGTPVSFTNKSDCHNIAEILLKVAIHTSNKIIKILLVCLLYIVMGELSWIILFFKRFYKFHDITEIFLKMALNTINLKHI